MPLTFRQAVFDALKTHLDERMHTAHGAMQAAQASANEEGKSSAGDKYETARAMGQLDRDLHARQYETARQERQLLDRLADTPPAGRVVPGSLVRSSAGWFALAVSAGKLVVDGQNVIAVSAQSPVGAALLGKRVGEGFSFAKKSAEVFEIG
jgi:transcription elongation GreA/GreB family factor